ncbi:MAG: hypothetical protein M0R77_02495 [Gammaproteobacteria bacterium]|nr:hypothetical protein [Gammaproteobacteria bacterium]
MKLYELISGAKIALSEEEHQIVEKIKTGESLDEREDHLAFFLMGRGILERDGDKYRVVQKPDVWRD